MPVDDVDNIELCKQIRYQAIRYLSYREHAIDELGFKLLKKFDAEASINHVLQQLLTEDLLSEERYVESYVRARVNRGYGPERIRMELVQKGVSNTLIDEVFEGSDVAWEQVLYRVWLKKFGGHKPADFQEKVQQWRFLQYRGFSQTQIKRLFACL